MRVCLRTKSNMSMNQRVSAFFRAFCGLDLRPPERGLQTTQRRTRVRLIYSLSVASARGSRPLPKPCKEEDFPTNQQVTTYTNRYCQPLLASIGGSYPQFIESDVDRLHGFTPHPAPKRLEQAPNGTTVIQHGRTRPRTRPSSSPMPIEAR